jgi:hypothetical protein
MFPWNKKLSINASEVLRRISMLVPPLTYVADSLYVDARCKKDSEQSDAPEPRIRVF